MPSEGEGAAEAWQARTPLICCRATCAASCATGRLRLTRARPLQLRYDADVDSDSDGEGPPEGVTPSAAATEGPPEEGPASPAEGRAAPAAAATATAEEAEEVDAAEDVRRAFAAAYADAEAGLPPPQHPPAGAAVAAGAPPAPPITGTEVRNPKSRRC